MDGGASRAAVHGATELDATGATQHTLQGAGLGSRSDRLMVSPRQCQGSEAGTVSLRGHRSLGSTIPSQKWRW